MLTPAQIAHFTTFGFVILRRVFSAAEMTEITREANQIWQEDRESQPQERPYQILFPFVERRPRLAELADDDRIYLPIEDLLGTDFVGGGIGRAQGQLHRAWASAVALRSTRRRRLEYVRVKVMIYLAPLQKDTGALRMIPGSQHEPLRGDLRALHEGQDGLAQTDISQVAFSVAGPDLPCHALEVEPGDVVLFDDRLYHAIYGKREGRSFITTKYVKFASEPSSQEHFEILKANDSGFGMLSEAFRNSRRPRIEGMVKKHYSYRLRARHRELTRHLTLIK